MIGNAGGIVLDPGFSGQIPKLPVINTAVRTPGQVAVTGDVTDLITSLGISAGSTSTPARSRTTAPRARCRWGPSRPD